MLRQHVDLEHWAAFQKDFQRVSEMALEVVRGQRGPVPRTVTFLSGDVHHSYVVRGPPRPARGGPPIRGRIIQAVCSPIRNPLPRPMRFPVAALSYGVAGPLGRLVAALREGARTRPLDWRLLKGPWFDNNLATLEVTRDGLRMWWAAGVVEDGRHDRPRLAKVAELEITP